MGIGGIFTKAELLRYAIARALSLVKLNGRNLNRLMTEPERYQVADDAIKEVRRHNRWEDLDDKLPPAPPFFDGPGWINHKK